MRLARFTSLLPFTLALCVSACDSPPPATDAGPGGGADSGPGGGADSGPGGGVDSGPGNVTGCPATLPEINIQFDSCPATPACGGDPTGVWVYQSACVENPVPDDLIASCPAARIENLAGTARGCVVADGTDIARDVSGEISATIVIPASCTFGQGCGAIESALGVTCTESAGECMCPYSTSWSADETDGYTVSGSTLTTDDGAEYEFCVSGSTVSYVEQGTSATEPGQLTLTM